MEKSMKLTDGWYFWKQDIDDANLTDGGRGDISPGAPSSSYDPDVLPDVLMHAAWTAIDLPHDWQIGHVRQLYKDAVGYYRKTVHLIPERGKRYMLYFEGVYMDSTVFVNGVAAGEWKYGYSSFYVDVTALLAQSGEQSIVVRVCVRHPNSRWYAGAGIYRDVYMLVMPRLHFVPDGLYISTSSPESGLSGDCAKPWLVSVSAEVSGENSFRTRVIFIVETRDGQVITSCASDAKEKAGNVSYVSARISVGHPHLWDPDQPYCYRMRARLFHNGKLCDEISDAFGFRSVRFTPDAGMFINDRPFCLHGVCMHHDLGCLGAAFHAPAALRQLSILKQMGVNAIRTAHNMPAPAVLHMADALGIVVVNEAFDMWRSPKTTYDYSRYFDRWYKKDVASWIRRDRNHPCIVMWSIGNEIYDTHGNEDGMETMERLITEVEKHDPRGNARVTLGSNYMAWEPTQKCADLIKLIGYNYGESYYAGHHANHPDWIIYGSETASIVQSRGIYHFPLSESILADDDLQCSSLGNSSTSWGAADAGVCIGADHRYPFTLGQFIWSGFDYIGEPTPYHTKNSYFGQIDTAGFAKDSFYRYKAAWTDDPVLHLFPYWDFNEGQPVDVCAYTNAHAVELFVNDVSVGRQTVSPESCAVSWEVIYHAGCIRAVAYNEADRVIAQASRHSFQEPTQLCVEADMYTWEGETTAFLTVSAVDEYGYEVENANRNVHFCVSGSGLLLGVDNGDSADMTEYQSDRKQMFSGRLLAVVSGSGRVCVTVSSPGLKSVAAELVFPAGNRRLERDPAYRPSPHSSLRSLPLPVRKIELMAQRTSLDPQHPDAVVTARILPDRADQGEGRELVWKVVDDRGIPSSNVRVIPLTDRSVRVLGEADADVRLRCMCRNFGEHIEIISQLSFTVTGMGQRAPDPYSFLCGSLYTRSDGDIGNGNEHGVSMSRYGDSWVAYEGLDFGPDGSDTVTVPIFELEGKPVRLKFWMGIPYEPGSVMVGERVYEKESIWNVYREEVFWLDRRIRGHCTFAIETERKIHIKGFCFQRQVRAFGAICAADCDRIYGDSYTMCRDKITNIGNNVSVVFEEMDFGEKGAGGLCLRGSTPLARTTIHLCFERKGEEPIRRMIEFAGDEREHIFSLEPVYGIYTVTFLFLPGSRFDFENFCFLRNFEE